MLRSLSRVSSLASSRCRVVATKHCRPTPQIQRAVSSSASGASKVAIIGSGNWGSAVCKIAAENCLEHDKFHPHVNMWVHEENFNGRKLTDVINDTKENAKYLPGVRLGHNVSAVPDLLEAVADAELLVFVPPHQFIPGLCDQLKSNINPNAKALSLTKGLEVRPEGPQLISELINEKLGIECSVLMGANVASGVAAGEFSEATVGTNNDEHGAIWQQLFYRPYFHVRTCSDVPGVEMCGTLKNIVALGAGFSDGLKLGTNSKAAFIRIGMSEMRDLISLLYPSSQQSTFFESCGVADLITTCFGGRNRKVAEAFCVAGGKESWEDLEARLLNGQKLQGVLTSHEVQAVLKSRGWEERFPLFTCINRICSGEIAVDSLLRFWEHSK